MKEMEVKMKKFLSAIALLTAFLLTACDGDEGTIVCTLIEENIETEAIIYVEDEYAVRTVTVEVQYSPDTTEDDLEFLRSLAMEGMEFELEGDYLHTTLTLDFIEIFGEGVPVDDAVEDLESEGYDCN